MEPKKLINDFLKVWDNNPKVFEETGAIAGLNSMLQEIEKIKQESLEDIANRIEEMCDEYQGLAEAIIGAIRKPKPTTSEDTSLGNILDNRYPELSKVLRQKTKNLNRSENI